MIDIGYYQPRVRMPVQKVNQSRMLFSSPVRWAVLTMISRPRQTSATFMYLPKYPGSGRDQYADAEGKPPDPPVTEYPSLPEYLQPLLEDVDALHEISSIAQQPRGLAVPVSQ